MLESFHHAILVFDIERFGRRNDVDQQWLRDQLRQVLRRVLAESGVSQADLAWQDTGDGGIFLVPSALPKRLLVDPFVPRLHAALREHNARMSANGQLRLRVALHAGEVASDLGLDGRAGYVGRDLNFACRLVDAAPLRECLAAYPTAQLVFAVSGVIHRAVIERGDGAIDASQFAPVRISSKEVEETAWVHVPGVTPGLLGADPTGPDPQDSAPRSPVAPVAVSPTGMSSPAADLGGGVHIHGAVTARRDVVMGNKNEHHHHGSSR
jgi:hypothetical protein